MKKVIHVNQHTIKANRKYNKSDPPITVKTYKSNEYASRVEIVDKLGNVIAVVKYQPDRPLSCGAHVWIETDLDINVVP